MVGSLTAAFLCSFRCGHFNRSSGVRLRIFDQNPNTRAIQMPNGRAIILQNIPGARPGKLARYDQLPLIGLLGSSTLQAPLPTPRRGRIRRLKFALATLRRSLQASCALQDPCGISTFRSLYMGGVFEAPMGVVSQIPEIRDVRPPCVRLNVRFSVAPEVVGPGLSLSVVRFCGSYIQSASPFLFIVRPISA